MSSKRTLTRDDGGVSEVISFLFGFVVSFLVLTSSLYVFTAVNTSAREKAAFIELEELTNRVLLAVQDTVDLAQSRNETVGSTDSTVLRFNTHLNVPQSIQGNTYTITLDARYVNGSIPSMGIQQSLRTPKNELGLPATVAACTATHAVCQYTGTGVPGNGEMTITYYFDASVTPVVNRISLS